MYAYVCFFIDPIRIRTRSLPCAHTCQRRRSARRRLVVYMDFIIYLLSKKSFFQEINILKSLVVPILSGRDAKHFSYRALTISSVTTSMQDHYYNYKRRIKDSVSRSRTNYTTTTNIKTTSKMDLSAICNDHYCPYLTLIGNSGYVPPDFIRSVTKPPWIS